MKNNFSLFDLLVASLTILFISLAFMTIDNGNQVTESKLDVVVVINFKEQARVIYPEAIKKEDVFLNSINVPLETIDVQKKPSEDDFNSLEITLRGKGSMEEDRYIFLGQKIAIGQKAEIRGNYFTQGAIKEIRYAK